MDMKEKLMGNFIGEFKTSVLPTMTAFDGNQYPLIRTTLTNNPINTYFQNNF